MGTAKGEARNLPKAIRDRRGHRSWELPRSVGSRECRTGQVAYESFKAVQQKAGLPMPVNKQAPKDKSPDLVMRYLDCAVLNHLHAIIEGPNRPPGLEPYDSVRAVFREGEPIFAGSMLSDRNHVQIAVRNSKCLKGIFLPL